MSLSELVFIEQQLEAYEEVFSFRELTSKEKFDYENLKIQKLEIKRSLR